MAGDDWVYFEQARDLSPLEVQVLDALMAVCPQIAARGYSAGDYVAVAKCECGCPSRLLRLGKDCASGVGRGAFPVAYASAEAYDSSNALLFVILFGIDGIVTELEIARADRMGPIEGTVHLDSSSIECNGGPPTSARDSSCEQ